MNEAKMHAKRVMTELREAGMTRYGLMKMETSRLPSIIHPEEHIGGVVYGRTVDDKVGSAMLVATDRRIIFLDVKPLFSTSDEISYFVVSGVKNNKAGPFAGIVLHTKVRDYGLRFVNPKCAQIFVDFIERHIELHDDQGGRSSEFISTAKPLTAVQSKVGDHDGMKEFLTSHDSAVLSTVDREGNARGTVIHFYYDDEILYFLTKTSTAKSHDMALHGQVALTIHEHDSLQMAQISGYAEQELDRAMCDKVYRAIVKPRKYKEGEHLPPIATMKKGDLITIRVVPTSIRYHNYGKASW